MGKGALRGLASVIQGGSLLELRSGVVVICAALCLPLPAAALPAQLSCFLLDGARIFAGDGTGRYLGFLGASGARDSVFNSAGPYGATYAADGVRNPFTPYGSPVSILSANSFFATSPPQIRRGSDTLARLSLNPLFPYAVSLSELAACRFTSLTPVAATADTDGDGVPDPEDAFPLDPDETRDTDNDGIGDNEDTDDDGDGLSDIDEDKAGTDRLRADTDGDGYSDGEEVSFGTDPLDGGISPADLINTRIPIWFKALQDDEGG